MTTTKAELARRAEYRVIAEQPDQGQYAIRVQAPDGRRATWYVRSQFTPAGLRWAVCAGPTGLGYIVRKKTYDLAVRDANLRARKWLGSCWGLRGPCRRFPG